MGQPPKDKSLAGKTRWGDPIYTINPSVPDKQGIATKRKSKIGNDRRGIIINDGTGEILGDGSATYYEFEEVDSERFVKLYLAGVKKAADLSKAGLSVFEWIYMQVMENPNTDRVNLSVGTIKKNAAPDGIFYPVRNASYPVRRGKPYAKRLGRDYKSRPTYSRCRVTLRYLSSKSCQTRKITTVLTSNR